jgi:hypothetical protein
MRRRLLVTAVLLGLWGAGAVALVALGDDSDSPPAAAPKGARPAAAPSPAAAPTVLSVRRAKGVPASWAARAAAARGVERVALVTRGQALFRRSVDASGRVVQRVRPGYAIPIDTLVVDPRAYASMLPADAARAFDGVGTGEVVLSRTGASLRRVSRGARLTLAGGATVRVAAVVDDVSLNGAEMLVGRAGRGFETRASLLLVRLAAPRYERDVKRTFRGERARVVARGSAAAARTAPGGAAAVVLPADLKRRFGDVAVRLPVGGDWVRLDPAWVRRNIVSERVPLLGSVTCNRKMVPALRSALAEVERRRLGRLIDPGDYAGCYAPRRIPSSGSLSLHALGLAVDFNASTNAQYTRGDQDPRLVRIMERHGFTWGGRWPTAPDPMHFEFQGR